MAAFATYGADDDRRRGRPGRVDEDRCSRAAASSRRCTPGATSRSASASTRWARSSTALAAHGGIVKPYGSTFLMFSDYMRGAVRLSALMGLPVVWVWTHDSVGLGEDGPTHQPIEHYASLRAIPHLWVMRPGDANETAEAWRVALEREDGRSRCCSRARTCSCSTATRSRAPSGSSAAPTCCGTPPAARPRADPDRDRRRGAADARGGAGAGRAGHARARRLDAVHGAVRGADARSTATRCCPPR